MPRQLPDSKTLKDDEPGSTAELPRVSAGDPLIGHTFGSYRIMRMLGEGGMGAVYLGEHPAIGSKVAIKVLHPRYAYDPQTVERFFNEARAVNLIGNDNIVQILDFNVAHERHYFVMEYLAGQPLQQLLQGNKPLPLARAGPIVLQCCRALQAAHERGIFHRDLKPDNVFLIRRGDRADFVKLVDFGIAKLTDVGSGVRTQAGLVLGTPAYMSPEQAAGETTIDARSDIYSLGVVFFQMVTGKLPFAGAGPSARQVLLAHLQEPPPRPRSLQPDLPEECDLIILRALQKNPDDRFQTMAELHAAVTDCLAQNGLSTELPFAGPIDEADDSRREARRAGPRSGPRVTPSPRISWPGVTPSPRTKTTRTPAGQRARSTRWSLLIAAIVGISAGVAGVVIVIKSGGTQPPLVLRAKNLSQGRSSEQALQHADDQVTPETAKVATGTPGPSSGTSGEQNASNTEDARTRAKAEIDAKHPDHRANAAGTPPPFRGDKASAAQSGKTPSVATEAETVELKLASAPEAQFIAIWPKGSMTGKTPMAIAVPKNAEVRIRYMADGYQMEESKIIASSEQVVFKALSPVH